MAYGKIYFIRNKINGKVYIGQTVNDLKKRYEKGIQNTHNEHLRKAIKYYGIDAFEIIDNVFVAESKEELDAKEIELIRQYKATNKRYGYNYLSGGHNGKHNKESREKIGKAQKGTLNHMYGKKGKLNPRYGCMEKNCDFCGKPIEVAQVRIRRSKHFYCSDECRKKDVRNTRLHKKKNVVTIQCDYCGKEFQKYPSQIKNKKHVYCSMGCKDAHQKTLLAGKNNPNHGNSKVSGGHNGRAKSVICITTNERFACARDAEKKYGISRGLVAACCRGDQKSSGGLEWKYESSIC